MSQPQFNEINAYACHASGEQLVPFTYKPRPLGDNDVELKISHCSICGTDLHTIDSSWGGSDYPAVVGHEIVGTVTAIGAKVSKLKIGDRAGVGPISGACLRDDCEVCSIGEDAHCPKKTNTFNGKWPDGEKAYGGFAEAIRVQSDLAYKIPDSIPSEFAAPLLCAGITVFTPMLRYKIGKGDTVGVIGIGGLGHLALQFANKLGADVYALSSSSNKKDQASKLGAQHFINTSNEDEVKSIKNKFKYLIVTSDANNSPWDLYSSFMKLQGTIILLAVPSNPITIHGTSIVAKNISLTGSLMGSIREVKETLAFAAEHNIRPMIEELPMTKVNEGIQRVRDGRVRYRMVLHNE